MVRKNLTRVFIVVEKKGSVKVSQENPAGNILAVFADAGQAVDFLEERLNTQPDDECCIKPFKINKPTEQTT